MLLRSRYSINSLLRLSYPRKFSVGTLTMNPSTVSKMKNLYIEDAKLSDTTLDMSALENGVYTGMRTVDNKAGCVFRLDEHMERLRYGAEQLLPENEGKNLTLDDIRARVFPSLQLALETGLKNIVPPNEQEKPIQMMVALSRRSHVKEDATTLLDAKFVCNAVFRTLPNHGDTAIIEIREAVREDPTVKSIAWAKARKQYQAMMGTDVNEVVMLHPNDAKHALYEGLSSNFFTYNSSTKTIYTAPQQAVLQGTMQTMLENLITTDKHTDIDLKYEFPMLESLEDGTSDGAFLTSTSRGLLPIAEVRVYRHNATEPEIVKLKIASWINNLRNELKQHMCRGSQSIYTAIENCACG